MGPSGSCSTGILGYPHQGGLRKREATLIVACPVSAIQQQKEGTQLAVNKLLQLFVDRGMTPSTPSDVNNFCSSVFRLCARRICGGMTHSMSFFIFKGGLG